MHRRAARLLLAASMLALAAGCKRPLGTRADGGGESGGAGGTGAAGATGGLPGAAGSGGNGGAPMRQACAVYAQRARPSIPADVLILLDASGTMNDAADGQACDGGCGAGSKWAQATAALNVLVAGTDTTVRWGLKVFPDSTAGGACLVTGGLAVPFSTGNAGAIAGALAARTSANGGVASAGNTPLRAAEQTAVTILGASGDGGGRLILLVTDGAPTCGLLGATAEDSPAAIQAVADALASGVPTIVVGASAPGGPTDATLAGLAAAGGQARAAPSPAYYPLSAVGDLMGALAALTSTTASCVYALPPAPTGTMPDIGVEVDGVAVPHDASHADGWDFADGSFASVRIFGPVCDDVMAGEVQTVNVVLYCSSHG